MKQLIALFIVALIIAHRPIKSQDVVSQYEKLQTIYMGLEYNTIAFSDLKQKWIISDPLLVREVYNRFIVRDALRINGSRVTLAQVKEKTAAVQDGKIVIDLRKRYYDDEIEFFAFVNEDDMQKTEAVYLSDPIKDGFLLRDVLGPIVYEKIRTQGYFFSNLTKTPYDTKSGYFYNAYLNLLEPYLAYWSTTSGGRNKYVVSLFGKWGNDYLAMPGWYLGDYAIGSSLTYYSAISQDIRDFLYDFKIGLFFDTKLPFKGDLKGKELLKNSGQTVYLRLSGDVLKYIFDGMDGYYLTVEGKYTVNKYKNRDFGLLVKDTVYSNRDYFVLGVNKRNIYNLGDLGSFGAGAGISLMDVYKYEIDPKGTAIRGMNAKRDFTDQYRVGFYVEGGLSRIGGLLQHNVSALLSVDAKGTITGGVKSQIMLSDQFGVDIRIYQSMGVKGENKKWRPESCIVFSPVLRINY